MALDFDRDREAFFEKHRRNDSLPGNSALTLIVLEELLAREGFEIGETNSKAEFTERIGKYFEEPIHVRRELVNFGYARHDHKANDYTIHTLELDEADVRANGHLERHATELGVLE